MGLGILIADLMLPLGYNVAYLYVVAILTVALGKSTKAVIGAGAYAAFATIAAFLTKLLLGQGELLSPFIFARSVTVIVIISTATLSLAAISAQLRARLAHWALVQQQNEAELEKAALASASIVTPIGLWMVDADGNATWDDTTEGILKELTASPNVENLLNVLTAADRARLITAVTQTMEQGIPAREEFRVRSRLEGAEPRWVIVMAERVSNSPDAGVVLRGTLQDITRWYRAEESAETLSHRLAQFASILPIILWTADKWGRIEYSSEALQRYAGNEEDELLGDTWVEAVDLRDRERVVAAWNHSITTGEIYDIEYRVLSADGRSEWFHLHAEPEKDDAGNVIRWWGTSVSVHAHHMLLDDAAAMAAQQEAVLESMPDGAYIVDPWWTVRYVNAAAERITEMTREETLGVNLWDILKVEEAHPLRQAMERSMHERTTETVVFQTAHLKKWLDVVVAPSPMGLNCFFRDITETRDLAEQLAQAQRLESVGQLTGGIAHDFNNLLTVVLGGADALKVCESLDQESRETVALIEAAAERGAELTHRLLSFSRRQPLEPRAVDLDSRLQQLSPLLRRTVGESIDLLIAPSTGAPPAEVDPGQFDNAVLNLVINARYAMPKGGHLTVEVTEVTLDEAYITKHAEVKPGRYVMVAVTDSGQGIAPESLPHLFDPFFTTKPSGKGSGMGLAMVWGFVKQSGGNITVYSEVGHGTAFKIYLPVAKGEVEQTPEGASPHTPHEGAGVVLLAEDDDLVRTFAAQQLRQRGYVVHESVSGPDAMDVLHRVEHIDLLFTDVIMPGGMTGRQLADAVLAERPDTPVLYASGYTENVIIHNGRLDAGVHLLPKPYSARQLAARISAMLGDTEGNRS